MYFRNTESIFCMTDQEAYIRSYYAYCILRLFRFEQVDYSLIKLYMILARRLKKMPRLEKNPYNSYFTFYVSFKAKTCS